MRFDPATLAHRSDSELLREFQGLSENVETGELCLRFATVAGEHRALSATDLHDHLKECEALLSEKNGDVFRQRQLPHNRKVLVWHEFQALLLAEQRLQKMHEAIELEKWGKAEVAQILHDIMSPQPARAARLEAIYRAGRAEKPKNE